MQASKDTLDLGEFAKNEKTGRTFYITDYPDDYRESIRWTLSNSNKRGDVSIRPTGDGRLEVNFELRGEEDDLGSHRRRLIISCGEHSVSLTVIYAISAKVEQKTIGNVEPKQKVVIQQPAPPRPQPAVVQAQPQPQVQARARAATPEPPRQAPRPRYREVKQLVLTTNLDFGVFVIVALLIAGFIMVKDTSILSNFIVAGVQVFDRITPDGPIQLQFAPSDSLITEATPVGFTHYPCSPGQPSYLNIGFSGVVASRDPSVSVRLRVEPSNDNSVHYGMVQGTEFEVIGGPSCEYDTIWWEISLNNGYSGWAAESIGDFYYLRPI